MANRIERAGWEWRGKPLFWVSGMTMRDGAMTEDDARRCAAAGDMREALRRIANMVDTATYPMGLSDLFQAIRTEAYEGLGAPATVQIKREPK